ncbi:MAG: hypothetical protein RSC23_03250 [Carnobacterium sp.]|uniref:hypothetical protein n=2 Tax=Carnobacterium sp. TaxID=48221 RepID=UPI002FCAE495
MEGNSTNEKLDELANVLLIQRNQADKVIGNTKKIKERLFDLTELNAKNNLNLDELLANAEHLLSNNACASSRDIEVGLKMIQLTDKEQQEATLNIKDYQFEELETIEVGRDWESYWENSVEYTKRNSIDLTGDPFNKLLSPEQQKKIIEEMKEEYTLEKAQCDKYDYLLAGISGVITGLVDVFLVGSPAKQGLLSKATDSYSEKAVGKYADILIKKDRANGKFKKNGSIPDTLSKKVAYLEKKFEVPYDATSDKMLGNAPKTLKMSTKNHHYLSLAHSPGLEGLIFSIIDQFTGSGTYLSNGKIVFGAKYDKNKKFELKGNTFPEKLFFGCVNWFGHLMSDLVGSSGSIANGGRGTGLPIPLTQFFQLFDNTRLPGCEDDIAKMARKAFEEGYDFRHGVSMAIPVLLNELLIRFLWMLKQYFYHKKPIKELLTERKSPELRRMLLVGHGCLCAVDGVDAVIRSSGNYFSMFMNMNFIAWTRFSYAGFIEVKALYGQNTIDDKRRNMEMDQEWNQILNESKAY